MILVDRNFNFLEVRKICKNEQNQNEYYKMGFMFVHHLYHGNRNDRSANQSFNFRKSKKIHSKIAEETEEKPKRLGEDDLRWSLKHGLS